MINPTEASPSALHRAIPDIEIGGGSQQLLEVESNQGGALSTRPSPGDPRLEEDEIYTFTFTWSGRHFQLNLQGSDRCVPTVVSSIQTLLTSMTV